MARRFTTRYDGACTFCGVPIPKGATARYIMPNHIRCSGRCNPQRLADFEAAQISALLATMLADFSRTRGPLTDEDRDHTRQGSVASVYYPRARQLIEHVNDSLRHYRIP